MNVRRVAELELRMMLANGSVRIAVASIALLMAVAGLTGWRWQRFRLQQISAVSAEAHDRAATWLSDARLNAAGTLDARYDKPDKPYYVYGFFPEYEVARQAPLALLAVGQSDLFAYYDTRSIVTGPVLYHEEEIQNPALSALGHFDVAFFFVVVLPVIIIALTFDLIASDRQTGRDRLLLAQAATLAPIVTVRAMLAAAIVSVTTLVSLALLIAWSAATAKALPAMGIVVYIGTSSMLYIMFWCALAVVVNAKGSSPARNAIVMLSVWGTLALFAPAAINGWSVHLVPTTGGAMEPVRERRTLQALNDTMAVAHLLHTDSLRGVYHQSTATGLATVADAELERETVEARLEAKRNLLETRQRIADMAAQLSPPLMMYSDLASAAHAGVQHALAFERGINVASNRRSFGTRDNVINNELWSVPQIAALVPTALTIVDPTNGAIGSTSWTHLAIMATLTGVMLAVGLVRLR